jgi:hypothetical protein
MILVVRSSMPDGVGHGGNADGRYNGDGIWEVVDGVMYAMEGFGGRGKYRFGWQRSPRNRAWSCARLTAELDKEGGYCGHAKRCVIKLMGVWPTVPEGKLRKIGQKTGRESSLQAGMRHRDEKCCGLT